MTFKGLLIGFLTTCAIALAAVAAWFSTDNFHIVIPGELYRSAQPGPEQLEAIVKKHGIKTVINLRGANRERDWYQAVRKEAPRLGIEVFDIEFRSRGLPDIASLLKLVDALQRSPRPILVHCLDGADRTGLASAIALLLGEKYKLDEAAEQTSLYYRVIWTDSTGRALLAEYQRWLQAGGRTHTPEQLASWIRSDYVDSMGNLRYMIDHVNKQPWSGKTATFEMRGNLFAANGWAFDQRNESLLKGVTVLLDDKPLRETRYGLLRKDVADVFEIPALAESGWAVEADLSGWPRRCYDMTLRLTRPDASQWRSSALGRMCLK